MSDDPPQPRELRPISALLLVAIHTLGFLLILAAGQSLSGSEDEISAVLVVGARLAAGLIALYVGLVRHAPLERTAAALRLERPDGHGWRIVGLGIAYGLFAAPLLHAIAAALLPAVDPKDTADTIRITADAPGAQWIAALGGLALIPLVDEALYRGLIQPRLVRLAGLARGLFLSVLLYSASQLDPTAAPLAVGLVALAHAAGNTWAAVAAAIAAKLGSLAVPLLLGELPWWSTALATLAAAGIVGLTWRVRRPR